MTNIVSPQNSSFTLADGFRPAKSGTLYIGKAGTDPTISNNQITVNGRKVDGTITTLTQPISLDANGKPMDATGASVDLLVDTHYSFAVYDAYGKLSQSVSTQLVLEVDGFSTLRNLPVIYEGQRVTLLGWNKGTNIGGGIFVGHKGTKADDGGVTAAGSGFYWERVLTEPNVVRLSYFGVVGNNNDETTSIYSAFTYAKNNKTKVVADYKSKLVITGSTDLYCYYDVDWNYSTVDCSNFTGKIRIDNPTELLPTTLSSASPEIVALKTNGSLIQGGLIAAWATNSNLQNLYLEIFTNVDFYTYRNVTYKKVERTRLFRMGALADDFQYPIDPSTITSINIYPVPDKVTYFENGTFVQRTNPKDLFVLTRNRMTVKNLYFSHDGGQVTTGMIWLNCNNFFDLTIDNVGVPFGQYYLSNASDPTSVLATYVFRMGDAYGLTLKNIQGDGIEWGVIGTDEVTNCEIYNCKLSRYDSHRPARGFIRVRDSHISGRGMSLQGAGCDVNISSTIFLNNSVNYAFNGLPAIVNTRGDAGGFFDGNIVFDNCTFVNNLTSEIHVVGLTYGPDYSQGLPAGSPITQVGFRNITFNNPIVRTVTGNSASRVNLGIREMVTGNAGAVTAANTPDLPFSISVTGARSKVNGLISFSVINTRPATTSRQVLATSAMTSTADFAPNFNINLFDSVLLGNDVPVQIVDTTGTYACRLNLDGFRASVDDSTVSIRFFMPGFINAINSRLREIRPFYNSVTLDKPVTFSITNCEVYTPDVFISWSTTATNRTATVSGCTIVADTMLALAKMAAYKLSGCKYILKGTGPVKVPIADDLTDSAKTSYNLLAVSWLSTDNEYVLECNEGKIPVYLPEPGAARYLITGYNESTSVTSYLKLYRNSGVGGQLVLTRVGSTPTGLYLK